MNPMNRKLGWACGALVVLALAVRGPSKAPSASVVPVPDRAATRLRGPAESAAPSFSREASPEDLGGQEILAAMRRGEASILPLAQTPEERAEREERQVRARLEADRVKARQLRLLAQQERIIEEHRARLIQAGFEPDLPAPRGGTPQKP